MYINDEKRGCENIKNGNFLLLTTILLRLCPILIFSLFGSWDPPVAINQSFLPHATYISFGMYVVSHYI